MPRVSIDGVGIIEFPDDIRPEEMDAIINRDFGGTPQSMGYEQVPPGQPQYHEPSPVQQGPQGFFESARDIGRTFLQTPMTEIPPPPPVPAPFLGGMLGGGVGALTRIPGAAPFGFGAGYAGVKQYQRGLPIDPGKLFSDFGEGAAIDIGGSVLGAGASKILGMGWKWGQQAFDKLKNGFSMLREGQLAQKGLPIPASAINPTEENIALANKARQTYPGNKTVQEAHNQLQSASEDMFKDIKSKLNLNVPDKELKQIVDNEFNKWAEMLGGNDNPLNLPSVIAVIDEASKQKWSGAAKIFWEKQANKLLTDPTPQNVRNIWNIINARAARDPFDRTARIKLREAINADLKDGYGEEVNQILQNARDFNFLKKRNIELNKLLNAGLVKDQSGTKYFNPSNYAMNWADNKNNDYLLSMLNSDEIAMLNEFGDYMGVIGKELGQKVSDKGLSSLLGLGGGLAAMGGGLKMLGVPYAGPALGAASFALPGIRYATSKNAGNIFLQNSPLYRQMLGESSPKEIVPGLVSIGGKFYLTNKAED